MAETKPPPPGNMPPRPPRADLETKVSLEFDKFSGFLQEYSHNIGESGMFIRSDTPKRVGTVFSFEFKLKDNTPLLSGWGEVRWVREQNEGPDRPPGMGIKFVDLDSASRDFITRIIRQRGVEGLASAVQGPAPANTITAPVASAPAAIKESPALEAKPPQNRKPPAAPQPQSGGQSFEIEELSLEMPADPQAEAFTQEVLQLSGEEKATPKPNGQAKDQLMKDLFGSETTAPAAQTGLERTEVLADSPPAAPPLESVLSETSPIEKPATEERTFPPPALTMESPEEENPEEESPEPEKDLPRRSRPWSYLVLAALIGTLAGVGYYFRDSFHENLTIIRGYRFGKAAAPTYKPPLPPPGKTVTPALVQETHLPPRQIKIPHLQSPTSGTPPLSAPARPPAVLPGKTVAEPPRTAVALSAPAKPTAPPLAATAANRVLRIEARTKGRETIIRLTGNGAWKRHQLEVVPIPQMPLRLLLKISDITTGYKQKRIKVAGSPYLAAIRTGHHPDNTLHVVLDLKGRRLPRHTLLQEGDILTVKIGK